MNKINNILAIMFFAILAIIVGTICFYTIYNLYTKEVTTPVEETHIVDSVVTVNHDIKITIENLNKEKNEKIEKVISLNDDSTLKLFYELLHE